MLNFRTDPHTSIRRVHLADGKSFDVVPRLWSLAWNRSFQNVTRNFVRGLAFCMHGRDSG